MWEKSHLNVKARFQSFIVIRGTIKRKRGLEAIKREFKQGLRKIIK